MNALQDCFIAIADELDIYGFFWEIADLISAKEAALTESAGCVSEEKSAILADMRERTEFAIERAKTEAEIAQIVAALKLSLNSL